MDDTDFFSTETITVPIGFRLFAIAQLSLSLTIGKIFGPAAYVSIVTGKIGPTVGPNGRTKTIGANSLD